MGISIGPFIVDKTPPKFKNDVIKVDNVNGYLLTSWSDDYVFDEEDPFPLEYEYAVGHTASQQDVQIFKSISSVGPCTAAYPPTCSAILISDLQWPLHANHDYYISLRVTNVAGLSSTAVSAPFRYNTQLPSKGVVLDVLPREREMKGIKDVNDVDYTSNRTHLAALWWGFRHPHLRIIFHICIGTEVGNCDNSTIVKRNSSYNYHVFKDLHLRAFQKYFITVKAIATTGTVSVSSDGLTVLDNTKILSEVSVFDGTKCTVGQNLSRSHHQFDTRPTCSEEIECQTSTSHVAAYWTVPNEHIDYTRETFIAVEERAHFGDFWKIFFNYTYVGKHNSFIFGDLRLQLGRFYRSSLRFCVESICFKPVKSDGFIVLHNYPKTGRIETVYKNISAMSDQLFITMERMFDPDVEDMEEALSMVNHYEWAIGNDIGVQTQWMNVHEFSFPNATYMSFRLSLNESIDFSKCRKVHVRGYNKAGMWSIVSSDIKNCHVMDSGSFIIPNIVVDAIGKPERSGDGKIREGYGRDIFLELNAAWKESDIDYTSYRNILSAVWPKLRHRTYKWAVLEIINSDIAMHYRDAHLKLPEPCSNPYAIKCGDTEKEYVNVLFRDGEELKHGQRYMICIYAPQTVVTHEKWVETLEEFSGCSDGVTVDLTPPIPGNVWIGIDSSEQYQTSTSDIYVNWNSFVDVEQFVKTRHNSGIKEYYLAIGSTIGGSDVVPFTNIGIANHYTLHNLRLQNGHEYFASIKAYDFTGQSSTVTSQPVIIDNTPPERTKYQILITERHIMNFTELNACWRGVFLDKESGIDYYLWGVGSRKGHDDVIAFTKTNQDCEVSTKHNDFDVNEGHSYFITVKAINRAHLINSASSLSYKVDQTAPIDGHVYDGCRQNATDLMKDIDYQVDSKTLFSHWEGFSDPHSIVKMYYISIGTCPRCQNVLQEVAVGTIYEFSLQNIHLTTGFNYFTTVTACNTADLCTSVTSDGVLLDDTPPTIGVVQDGVEKDDINYQFLRSYIACKWYGFTDPQSGLDKLSWTAGTKPSSDDIVPLTELPITNPIVNVNLTASLPLLKRIYVTVRVYNKAGLYSEASSNGFIIDETPPVFFENPFLVQDLGSIYKDSIVLRSSFKVKWTVEDKESFIDRQYISIGCHIGGNFSSSSIQLNGIVREYTFSRLDLHDGVKYIVHMISCNRAKLCTESKSDPILVDSSPPTPGMFAINTDHVSKLGRMIDGWMTWSKYKLWLSWLGFTDLHTGIEKYLVNVGSQYMQSDINKVKGSAEVFPHNDSGIDKGDEGFVQTFSIETVSLSPYEHIYVSVWAVNNVGLSSPMIHSQFRLVPGGSLELIRRCTSKTCLGHCVCSTQNGRCALEGKQCHDVSKDNTNNDVGVYDVTNLQDIPLSDIQYTPSVVELAAKWQVIQVHGLPPLWYEWSVGLATNDEPEGVFDNLKDVVWRYAGQTNQAFLSIERGREPLDESVTYSFFVRAWYTDDTYAVFKTNGVTVLSTPLATSKIKGSSVSEQRPGHWKKDIDYIKPGFPFTIKWSNVFINADKIIERFNIYLSSFPGGYDEHIANIDLPGTVTTYNVSRIPLTPGIVFYSNVVAYSFSGIHSTATSDGITVDIVPPSAGSVKDGTGIYDCDYQDDPQVVSASWHGFSDLDSVITHYMWCVQTVSELILCNIRAWENVGIQTFVSRTLNGTSLSSGIKIQSLVYAVDIVGHESEIVKSNGVIVDVTQPIPVEMIHLDINLASNPSFELFEGNYVLLENETDYSSFCFMTEYVQLLNWTKKSDSCVIVLKSNRNNAFDGRSFVFLNGEISQNVSSLEESQLYRITFVTAHPIWEGNDGANNEGFVQIGNERHVFLVYTKQDRHTAQTYDIPWHHHTFYFRPVLQNMTISLGSLFGNTGLYFDDARIQKVNMLKTDSNQTSGKHVFNHIVTIHQWSSVHASWHFVDPESPIFDYTWAIGYTEGSTEVQGFQSVGLSNFAYNYNVSLPHTSTIHVTVIATNAAGLMTKIHAESLLVDKTPPEITCVNDGIGEDIDAQSESEISANWEVDDLESGLESCQFSVGYQLYGNELQTFQKIPVELRLLSKVFPYDLLFMRRIYVTIRCKNKAGLQSSLSTDGVIVSNLPPVSTRAQVNILPLSNTEYMAYNGYQKNKHTMRIKWSGFEDIVGLDSYLVSFKMDNDGDAIITRSITAEKQDITYLVLTGLDLKDGNYTVAVQAINKMYVRSDQVKASITISSLQPTIERSSTLHVSINNRTVHISWKDVFCEDRDTFYEVSAGTFVGSADIIQWQETKNTFITFFIPPRIKSIKGLTSYITVRGIYANGMFNVVNHRINLSDI
ncbi:Hypothetical predicted protein [Mytilus galloprovincialis]|uniref:Uncharacterized protein n=1 Tax=Mytilus galloprovincialis TaxID=29158 RepID=A0A8B6HKM2_MYTGA|nr:Hypothetical predicted protein [Mytilus galloprovincialis]